MDPWKALGPVEIVGGALISTLAGRDDGLMCAVGRMVCANTPKL